MASWQEIVKRSERETKLNTEGKTPNGKWELRVACENATQLTATRCTFHTLDTPHTFPADSQMRRQLAAKRPTESTDLLTPAEKQTGLARGISESVGKATPQPFATAGGGGKE